MVFVLCSMLFPNQKLESFLLRLSFKILIFQTGKEFLVFSATLFKIDQTKNQNRSTD